MSGTGERVKQEPKPESLHVRIGATCQGQKRESAVLERERMFPYLRAAAAAARSRSAEMYAGDVCI